MNEINLEFKFDAKGFEPNTRTNENLFLKIDPNPIIWPEISNQEVQLNESEEAIITSFLTQLDKEDPILIEIPEEKIFSVTISKNTGVQAHQYRADFEIDNTTIKVVFNTHSCGLGGIDDPGCLMAGKGGCSYAAGDSSQFPDNPDKHSIKLVDGFFSGNVKFTLSYPGNSVTNSIHQTTCLYLKNSIETPIEKDLITFENKPCDILELSKEFDLKIEVEKNIPENVDWCYLITITWKCDGDIGDSRQVIPSEEKLQYLVNPLYFTIGNEELINQTGSGDNNIYDKLVSKLKEAPPNT